MCHSGYLVQCSKSKVCTVSTICKIFQLLVFELAVTCWQAAFKSPGCWLHSTKPHSLISHSTWLIPFIQLFSLLLISQMLSHYTSVILIQNSEVHRKEKQTPFQLPVLTRLWIYNLIMTRNKTKQNYKQIINSKIQITVR